MHKNNLVGGFFLLLATVASADKCLKFIKTANCDAQGKVDGREKCDKVIEAGISGYCSCESPDGSVVQRRMENCNHASFTCADSCRRANEFTCKAWRPANKCGELEAMESDLVAGDGLACDTQITEAMAGFCECGDGRKVVPGGCHNPKFSVPTTCQRVCERGPQPYEELGTHKWASAEIIKKNFRKLSLKYHPDRVSAGDEDRFPRLREAMDILEDPVKKAVFDQGSYDMVGKYKNNKLEKASDIEHDVRISLEDVYLGKTVSKRLSRVLLCPGCKKKSKSNFCAKVCTTDCPAEFDLQMVRHGNMMYQQKVEKPSKFKCRRVTDTWDIKLEKGVQNGEVIKYPGEASYEGESHYPGDLVFKVVVKDHPSATRAGDHLIMNVDITLRQSLIGFEKEITHLDGHKIILRNDKVTEPKTRFRVKGEGFWNQKESQYGDLVVTVDVKYPRKNLMLPESVKTAMLAEPSALSAPGEKDKPLADWGKRSEL